MAIRDEVVNENLMIKTPSGGCAFRGNRDLKVNKLAQLSLDEFEFLPFSRSFTPLKAAFIYF